MNGALHFLISFLSLLMPVVGIYASDVEVSSLEGTWQAKSAIRNGKDVPRRDVAWMRFRFQGKKLFVRGNMAGDKEVECSYQLQENKVPKLFDFTLKGEKKPARGIFKRDGETLTVCIRPNTSKRPRPQGFESRPGTDTLLIVFEMRQREGEAAR